ncbi:MAG: BREX-1 system adenine-specific DNA-methyltransferase PglX [Eubacteriales bacterium]|nr:BREX-1 system adenine-specific DNA-methyltransferase PglX [Eubacteriales bacterium]
MDKRILQTYSTWAKENLENQIEVSLKALGINGDKDIKKAKKVGDVTTIEGDPTSYPADFYRKRESIINLIGKRGYQNIIEEFAYTWFNRFVALRFMEVHGFLPHGFRVLSNPAGGIEPEILKNLKLVQNDLKLDMNLCNEYKQQGKIEELFRHVLIKQCNVLSGILPMLFSSDMSYLELLLPKNLLKGETVITRLNEIPEEAFMEDVEIIGWMYQFYISSKKHAVYASKKTITKDTLPAVTQLFTPDWIVRYMAQNSVGRLWLESYPSSALRSEMKYYVEDAEQTEEVQKKIDKIKYKNVNPEEIRIIEPCCGSGHILVYVFDLLFKMYEERGYQKRDIPTLILKNNLVGLDVDKRAVQLASFALIMKARSVNNRFFNEQYYETPHVYELQDSQMLKELGYRKQLKDLNLLNDEEMNLITYLVDTFENGKTIGSLLKVKPIDFACLDGALDKVSKNTVSNLFNLEFLNAGMKRLRELSNQAKILLAKYDVMITNPPYRPISSMEASVSEFATKNYPNSKTDMFAMFMETNCTKINGFIAMINMHSWMFISSYADLRRNLFNTMEIVTMAHLGKHAFDSIPGERVQTTAFIMRNVHIPNYKGVYCRLVDGENEEAKRISFLSGEKRYKSGYEEFFCITDAPTAYWISDRMRECFKNSALEKKGYSFQGIITGNVDVMLKLWHEVSYDNITFGECDYEVLKESNTYYPYVKGGTHRKWAGNQDYVIHWFNNGDSLVRSRTENRPYFFRNGITWSLISMSDMAFRYVEKGFLCDVSGSSYFPDNPDEMWHTLGLLNSKVMSKILQVINPTTNLNIRDILLVPYTTEGMQITSQLAKANVDISKADWDSFEKSWDFPMHPFLRLGGAYAHDGGSFSVKNIANYYGESEAIGSPIEASYLLWEGECNKRHAQLKANEEELNRIFIDIYGLHDELTPEVEDVTIRLADKERDIRSLISYLVGVAMGRYSLDVPGLAYAGGDWDASKYVTYQPDYDGIIPIYNGIGMEDGLTTVLIKLIKQIYGEDTYRQNIDFIAEALGKNNNESSEEALNRYLNDGFYADHLKVYQKRPIYWLFTSGKKDGFKCLIYMHRYNEDTLARINGKYFLPESTRKKNELDELNGRIAHAEGRDKLKLEKLRQNLAAAYNEAIEYGQVLDHMANQYISIDLDDGVKTNYVKFQGIEIVTDSGTKVKKDLLSPLK